MISADHPRFSCTSDMSLTIYGKIFCGPLVHTNDPSGTGVNINCHMETKLLDLITMKINLVTVSLPVHSRFFTEIASDVDIPDTGNHSLSFINDANVLALHRLLWNNQEKIGDYLSSSRYFMSFFPLIGLFLP